MAPRKSVNNGGKNAELAPALEPTINSSIEKEKEDVSVISTLATDPLPTIKVNNANLGEVKAALDEIVKKHLQNQSFTPSLLHPTVHLSLGYSSVILALSSVLYSLKVDFEDSKPILWIAVVGYTILQVVLWAWKKWIEKGEVFKGKRRRMVKRIETDHIQILSSTSLDSPSQPQLTISPHTRPSSPSSVPTSPNPSTSPSTIPNLPTTTLSSSTNGSETVVGPSYNLQLTLSITSNNGKSLIHKSRLIVGKLIGELIDEDGGIEKNEFERWLNTVLDDLGAGADGEDEFEGNKEE
ncbi:hypothetical protein I204_02997 [Kwoniella mangroviensis CBS 8886]|uniref:uncharacterized protein n=1 Tax=Kwoniella mangroviensis CBS 8507 TaxID=1296122 RepID=UPI00080CEA22|nr:uncharacterized protein I203_00057 [Kwoniella mangroviensis CBS 8507]OCF69930.1 hypothetical protein I203_00057 [Kwoniella mangroviensis CBS 8507]OCF75705.1 hypothetical protein I204_02997 [Kwoniella mangroviensis CBS 8886]